MEDIALIGFMGSGKSSVGKELSRLLPDLELVDLDAFIEAMTGKTVPEIFREQGEEGFRELERMALESIFMTNGMTGSHSILALGGGTVTTGACRRMVRQNCRCFYLRGSEGTLVANLKESPGDRPLLQSGKDLGGRVRELMAERAPFYEATAHHIVDIDGKSFSELAADIVMLLGSRA